MIIILTQCFPPKIGGIESLIENLSIELSKTHEVLVLADQYDNCLLYTSPSPRDKRQSRMPACA